MITERPAEGRSPGLREAAPREGRRTGTRRDIGAVLKAYVSLTKPRIVELLLITTVPAMMLAAGGWPDLGIVLVVLIGGSLAAGAASALNCYIDRDIDQLMRRTKRRPLATHTVTPRAALIFGLTLAVVSLILMAVCTNWLATALTAAAIFYYDVVYTLWLKRRTPQNTFWGGICGAAPGADRLGRRHRRSEPRRMGAFCGCVLLADAAFLRLGHQVQGRLCAGRHSDAAGGPLGPPGEHRDRPVHRPNPGVVAAGLAGGPGPDLRRDGDRLRGVLPSPRRC